MHYTKINDLILLPIADFTYIIGHRIILVYYDYNRFSRTAHEHAVHFPRVSTSTENGRSFNIII